jgi:hypothetical protein
MVLMAAILRCSHITEPAEVNHLANIMHMFDNDHYFALTRPLEV